MPTVVPSSTFTPFVHARRLEDAQILSATPLFAQLPGAQFEHVVEHLGVAEYAGGATVVSLGETARGAFVVLTGRVAVRRGAGEESVQLPGMHWGEGALEVEAPEAVSVRALEPSRIALLSRTRFLDLSRSHPAVALEVLRRAFVLLVLGQAAPTSSPAPVVRAGDGLPREIHGALVVAARANNLTISLNDSTSARTSASPVTIHDWEGREIYRRSAGLLFLEAAARLGERHLRLGPSWTSGRRIIGLEARTELPKLAERLTAAVAAIAREDRPFRSDPCEIDLACAYFEAQGWDDVKTLVESSASSFVHLASCGEVRVPSPGPMVPSTGWMMDVRVLPHPDGLFLDFGDRLRAGLVRRPVSTMVLETEAPLYGASMTNEERHWLAQLGVVSVGAFNRACITGEVRDLIDVAEAFHEKRIASLADDIAAAPEARIVAVAGPSSSGKTTFLRRLGTQLRANGIQPVGISLDDYYVDRERTVRDASGERDYEALEAVDRPLLRDHLASLLAGSPTRSARYDFLTGRSEPQGGPLLRLPDSSVLILEGIHALNPDLYLGDLGAKTFGVFIHPATSLPFDPLSSLEPSEVRLLRRIVRDRHTRGATAEQNLSRWQSVRRGERIHIDPWRPHADRIFDTSLIYEVNVLKIYAERYLMEVPRSSPHYPAAVRLRRLLAPFVPIYSDRVPPTSILREFIGNSAFSL